MSLPLGAGRLTRDWLRTDPPGPAQTRDLRKHVRTEMARTVGGIMRYGRPDRTVAASKTFRQLAGWGRRAVQRWTLRAPGTERHGRGHLGVAAGHDEPCGAGQAAGCSGTGPAPQLAAGVIVADAAMDLFGVPELEICPWALREGVILRRIDLLSDWPAPPVRLPPPTGRGTRHMTRKSAHSGRACPA